MKKNKQHVSLRKSRLAKPRTILTILLCLIVAAAIYSILSFSNSFLSQIGRSPAPANQEELLHFGANEIPALRTAAASRLDKSRTAFLGDIYKPVATSSVDVCYQAPVAQALAVREYRKYCYVRKVVLIPLGNDWQTASKQVYDRLLAQGWSLPTGRYSLVGVDDCFYKSGFKPDGMSFTEETERKAIDVFAGPIIPAKGSYDGTLCRFNIVGQTQGVFTTRKAESDRKLVFNQKDLFDEDATKRDLQESGYDNVLRIGFTEEYFNEKIK